MSLCNVVSQLANRLSPHVKCAKLQKALAEIARMPEWKAEKQLNRWENRGIDYIFLAKGSDYWYLPEDEQKQQDPIAYLVGELLEFGRYNLYSAYQKEPTIKEFERLLALFREYEIPGSPSSADDVDLTGW